MDEMVGQGLFGTGTGAHPPTTAQISSVKVGICHELLVIACSWGLGGSLGHFLGRLGGARGTCARGVMVKD